MASISSILPRGPFLCIFLLELAFQTDASSTSGPECEIIWKLSDCPKESETVDPNINVTFNCSIKNGNKSTVTQGMTWKQVHNYVQNGECLVLQKGNKEKRIYLARKLNINGRRSSSPAYLYENTEIELFCDFEGWPLPNVTWYMEGKPITSGSEGLNHKEVLQDGGTLKSTLHVPGHEEFQGVYTCSGNNAISSGWQSKISETMEVIFKCNQGDPIKANGSSEVQVDAFDNITLSCLFLTKKYFCPYLTWHFKNNPEPLKDDGKYEILPSKPTHTKCKKAFNLLIMNVTEDDQGKYSCIIQSCWGEDNSSDEIELKVYSSPPLVPTTFTSAEVLSSEKSHSVSAEDSYGSRKWMLPVIIISALGVFVLLLLGVIWWVKKKRTYKRVKRGVEGVEKDILFISYSSKDFGWVSENLISVLEKHSILYSIHSRDFELGRPIVQNMADSVYNSRQVLIVLSNNYLASNFCREELHMAVQRRVDTGDSSLVLVTIDKLQKSQLPAALRDKNLLDFEKHKKKQDWETKLLNTVLEGNTFNSSV